MDIEEVIVHKPYRGFDLIHLRQAKVVQTRWQITRSEAGMTRNYGFVATEALAHRRVDGLFDDNMKKP